MSQTKEGDGNSIRAVVDDIVLQILRSADPSEALLASVIKYETNNEIVAAIFEATFGIIRIKHYWIYYCVSRAYSILGRSDACFLTAGFAIQFDPNELSWHMYSNIYNYFKKRELYKEAAGVFIHQVAKSPSKPIDSESEFRRIQSLLSGPRPLDEEEHREISHTFHCVEPTTVFRTRISGRYGIDGPNSHCYALQSLGLEAIRREILVAEIPRAKLIIYDNNVLVYDSEGRILPELSVSFFPEALANSLETIEGFATWPKRSVEEACVIADCFSTANLCHFLLDHIPRLALYDRVSLNSDRVVVGPSLVRDYQKQIVQSLGVDQYIGVSDHQIIEVDRLLVSQTCKKDYLHAAQLGSYWALDFIRKSLAHYRGSRTLKLYISRSDAAFRRVRNEQAVLKLLEEAGFESVVLGTLDYARQIDVFLRATHVVGMHGAGLTNMVFCGTGTDVLEICHPIAGSASYAVLGSSLDVNYSIMVGADADSNEISLNDWTAAAQGVGLAGPLSASDRDVIVDLEELARWLADTQALL